MKKKMPTAREKKKDLIEWAAGFIATHDASSAREFEIEALKYLKRLK